MILRRAADLFAALPDYDFDPNFTEWDGVRIHYVDEGSGPPVVLFHGEPTWSFLYRNVIPHLVAAGHRVIAADMPGFGKSDAPTDPAFYSYENLVSSLLHLVDHLELEDATAVVQDWGGPVGLRIATERTERFRRLVIMNTGLYTGGPAPDALRRWRAFVERTPDLPIGMVMRGSAVSDWPEDVVAGYEAPFPTSDHKVGAWRLPLIVPMDDGDAGAAEMQAVMASLTEWTDPVLVLFSDQDPIFPLRVGERFAAAIPGAGPLEVVEGVGHFLQEEAPVRVATAIAGFLSRT